MAALGFHSVYNKRFSVPLRKKRKNEYDADEEARYNEYKVANHFIFKILHEYLICRLEKIVFGDPSDVINNLLDDQSMTKVINEPIDIKNEKERESDEDQEPLVLNNEEDAKLEEKKAVWIDDDDYNYTYV